MAGYRGIPRDTAGYRGIPRDTGRYREIPGDTRHGEISGDTLETLVDTERYAESGEIRGDRGEYAEIEGDTGRSIAQKSPY